jgi:hypothetical protein
LLRCLAGTVATVGFGGMEDNWSQWLSLLLVLQFRVPARAAEPFFLK